MAWVTTGDEFTCTRCGFLLELGEVAVASVVMGEDDEDDWEERDAEHERQQQAALARVDFPVYAVPGQQLSMLAREDDVHVYQHLGDGLLVVASTRGAAPTDDPRTFLEPYAVTAEYDTGRSQAAMYLQYALAKREARRRVADMVLEERSFLVDGEPRPFQFGRAGTGWMALRDHISLVGGDIDPAAVTLEHIADLSNPNPEPTPLTPAAPPELPRLLNRGEVSALIDELGLAEHRDAILAAVRPAYRLEPGPEDSPHRIGGLPDLAPDETWPRDELGIPQTLIAQIDCSRLPPLESDFAHPAWGHDGRLVRIFAALDGRDPEPGPACALACPADAPVTRAALPPRPEEILAENDSLRELRELPVRLVPMLTAADVLPDADYATIAQLRARLAGGAGPEREEAWNDSQLLGHAETEQGEDPRYVGPGYLRDGSADEDWAVLINIVAHRGMSFGDGGLLSMVIGVADLATGRYDRIVAEKTMG